MKSIRYMKVLDGKESNAGSFSYKENEVMIADNWNPNAKKPIDMGGFNFSTEDKILRWLHRGDTLYDVIIPEHAEVVLVNKEKGIYRTNMIIIKNPRPLTEELVLKLYKKNTLKNKLLYECLVTLLYRNHIDVVKKIIIDNINKRNINAAIKTFERYVADYKTFNFKKLFPAAKEIYVILKEIQSNLLISICVDKKVYKKELTKDKIINLYGQSGSGKSTYAKKNFPKNKYLVIDTDEIFSNHRFAKAKGINKELGEYFRNNCKIMPNLHDNFDLIYEEIIRYCKKYKKPIVIDCAQFHEVKDINVLKGKIIIIRTSINTCYSRCIKRYQRSKPKPSKEQIAQFVERKKALFTWYHGTNKFIQEIDAL